MTAVEPARFAWLEAVLKTITEVPAALLVVVELGVLSAGVFARYVLNRPLVWSDEVASLLFLWLAMLGAVIALRRDRHMKLTAVVRLLPKAWTPVIEAVVSLSVMLFVLAMMFPAIDFARSQSIVRTPALHIPDTYRVDALAVGFGLMVVISVARLLERTSWRDVVVAVLILAAVAALFWIARPALLGMGNANLFVFFIGLLLGGLLLGIPVAFTFGIATLSYLTLMTTSPLTIVVSRMTESMTDLLLLSIPLFIFLGGVIEITGVSRALIGFMVQLLAHVRGGLSYVLLSAMYLISGISGSKAADMAAVAPVLFPEMKRLGYDQGELIGILSASGAMCETIPPSIVLITVGAVTGTSIAALFTGGLMPAAVGTIALMLLVHLRSRNQKKFAEARAPLTVILKAFVVAIPALAMPFMIRASVVGGVVTATEVSTIGIAYAVVVGLLVYRTFEWRKLYSMLVATASLTGAVLFIIGMATAMSWALVQSGFAQQLVSAMEHIPGGRPGFLAVSIIGFAILGSLLEGIPSIVLLGPLLFPAAQSLGIPDVQYAMILILSMGLGLHTPPLGLGFYFACAIGEVSADAALGRVWSYLGVIAIVVVIVAAVPWISTGFLHASQ